MKQRADYKVSTLESKVEVQVSDAVKSIETLISSLGTLKSALNNTINSTKNNKLKDNVDSSTKQLSTLKKTLGLGTLYIGMKKLAQGMWNIAQSNINLIETNNLFEVSMGKVVDQYGELDEAQSKYYLKAMAFQDEMNKRLLTNKAELKSYQAMYYSMFKSQGINKDASYLMSESLTKAGYDIASLYNLDVDDAMDKIKSGIAGQVEPLRKIGVDISESALTKVIREAGISDRSVQQLSYAEKEVARYIAILEQAGQAQGDFAKTFDQPANQIKVLKSQFEELKQVAGSFVTNAFGGILVWANAIIMTIKEILKAFASLFGWGLEAGGSSGLGEVSDSVDDISSGLGTASGKAKELKKQLMGFDEINNITPQTNSGGSGSGGVATGIDNKLLQSLKEWDNKMSGISSKAQKIRDDMLEWLGFERNDDGTWKLKEGYTNFEKIKDIVIGIGTAILGWKLAGFITGISEAIKKAGKLSTLLKGLKTKAGLAVGITSLYFYLDGMSGIKNGEVTSESVIKSIAGALGVGVASSIMGLSIPVSGMISLMLVGITFQSIGEKTVAGQLTKAIREKFGIDKQGTMQIAVNQFAFTIKAFDFLGLEDLAKIAIKNILEKLADFVEKIPIIGEKISIAIRNGIEAEEKNTTETITTTLNSSINASKEGTKPVATTAGMAMMQNAKIGISSQQANLNKAVEDVQKNSLVNARPKINNTSQTSGMQMMLAMKQEISNQQGSVRKTTEGVADTIEQGLNTVDTTSVGKQVVSGVAQGIENNKNSWSLWSSLRNLKNVIVNGVKSLLDIHSPSRVMADLAKFIPLGMAQGIDSEADSVYSSIKKLNDGIKVNTKDFAINTNQYVDYGAISGNINAQSQVSVGNNIVQGIAQAVSQAMQNTDINVNIEAKTEEGVIVKKATEGINNFIRQTGELPFPLPV